MTQRSEHEVLEARKNQRPPIEPAVEVAIVSGLPSGCLDPVCRYISERVAWYSI